MDGLKDNWQSLPRHSFQCRTTSSSGEIRDETLEGILLCDAAEKAGFDRCTVRCADGAAFVFSRRDAGNACLAQRGDHLTLCFFRDSTRRRWLKDPVVFIFD